MREEEWLTKNGWSEIPFNASDTTIQKDLIVGFDDVKDEMEKHVASGRNYFVFLHGPVGAGKTTLLNWLEKEELGKGSCVVVKFSSPPTKNEIVDRLTYIFESDGGLFTRITELFAGKTKTPKTIHDVPEFLNRVRREKKVLFLIDELEKIRNNAEMAEGLNELKNVMEATKSITLIAGLSDSDALLTDSMRSRIQFKTKLRKMNEEEVGALVLSRIKAVGGRNPFTADALKAIYTQSDGAPRYAIKLCRKAVEIATLAGHDEVTVGDIVEAHGAARNGADEERIDRAYRPKPSTKKGEDEGPGEGEGKGQTVEGGKREQRGADGEAKPFSETFLDALPPGEMKVLKFVHSHPDKTAEDIATGIGVSTGTMYYLVAAVQGRKRQKKEVPYPLLEVTKKDGKVHYRLKDHVERFFAKS